MTLSGCQGAPSAAPFTKIGPPTILPRTVRALAFPSFRSSARVFPLHSTRFSAAIADSGGDLDHGRHFLARAGTLIVAEAATARDHDFGQRAASVAVAGVIDHAGAQRAQRRSPRGC